MTIFIKSSQKTRNSMDLQINFCFISELLTFGVYLNNLFFYCNYCFLFRTAVINTVVLYGLSPGTYYTLTVFISVNFFFNLSIVIFFSPQA